MAGLIPRPRPALLALALALPVGGGCVSPATTATASLKATRAPGAAEPSLEASVAVECKWPGKAPAGG